MEDILGSISIFAGDYTPENYLPCDGRLLQIAQNQALFSLIGNKYGGDNRTTFALPDFRSRIPVGAGNGAGLTPRAIGQTGGSEKVTLALNQIPGHTHAFYGSGGPKASYTPTNNYLPTDETGTPFYANTSPTTVLMNSEVVGQTGASQGHNNLPPYVGVTFLICVRGIYPSRD